jgi:ABC-type transport system involved in multi-copper enzyme maturation permease subunit
VKEQGWRMGFANLLHNENLEWWGSRRWLTQAGLWLLILNGMVALVMFVTPAVMQMDPDNTDGPMDPISMGIPVYFQIGATALAIGTVILVQGEVVGERQTGITAWILSKPVARPAYFLAKMVAHSIGILVIMIGFQSAVAYGLFWLANGGPLPLLPFLIGVGGLMLHTFFYLTLTLMLGVFARTRSQVLGVAMGSLFGGMLLLNIIRQLGLITPWSLPNILPALVIQIPLPFTTAFMPILMTAIWSIVFIVAALWKLPRLEF